jgi:hypothetical protein
MLELLSAWLPGRSWYRGETIQPVLAEAGGFRLDDPDGEVGLEFVAATDESDVEPVTYHLPLSYRRARLPGGDDALIGTVEDGRRWIYDGTRDPVLISQMFALLLGEAEPRAQRIGTADPSVTRSITGHTGRLPVTITEITDRPRSTDITVRPAAAPGPVMLRVNRVLRPNAPGLMIGTLGHVTAEWAGPGLARSRGRFIVLRVP